MRKKMDLDSIDSSSRCSSTSRKKVVSDSPVCLICLKFIRKPGFSTSGSNGADKETENKSESNSVVLDGDQSQSEIIDHHHDHDQDDDDQNQNLLQKLLSLSKDYLEVPSESIKEILVNQSKSKNQIFGIWDSDIFCASCIRTVSSTCQFYNELCFLQLQLHRMLGDLNQTLQESTKSKSMMMGKRLHQKLAKQLKLSGKDCTSRIQEIRMLLAENCQKKIESQSQLLKDEDDGVPKPETQSPSSEISNASSSGAELDATVTTFNSEDNHSVNEDIDIDTDTGMPDDSVSVLPLLLSSSVHLDGNKENYLKEETPSSDTGVIVRRRPAKRKRVEVEQKNEMATPRILKKLEPLWSKRPIEMLSRTRSGSGSFSPFDSTLSKMNELYAMEIEDKGQAESHRPLDLRWLRGPIRGIKKPFKCLRCNRGFANIGLIKIHEKWCKPTSTSTSNGNENKIITASANGKVNATKARVAIGISSPKEKSSFTTPKTKTDSETKSDEDEDVRVIEFMGSDSVTPLKRGKKKKGEPKVVAVYRCKLCDSARTYPNPGSLRTHELIHLDNKPFACGKCGLGYAQKNNALNHEAKCTGIQKPQEKSQTTSKSSVAAARASRSKCRYCGKYFQSRISVTNHQNGCRYKPKKEEEILSKKLKLQSESGIRDQAAESEADADASSTGKSSTPDLLSQLDLRKVNKGKETKNKMELDHHEQEQQTADKTGGTKNQQESPNSDENESWFDADTGDDLDLDLTTTTTADIDTDNSNSSEVLSEGESEQVDEDSEREASSFPNSGIDTNTSNSSSFMEVVEDSQTEVNDDSNSNSPDVLETFLGERQISGIGRSSDHDLKDNDENELKKTEAEKTIAVTVEEDKDEDSMELLEI